MTMLLSLQEIGMYIIAVIMIGLISYPLSALLSKLNKKLLFALPIFFGSLGGVLLILSIFSEGWSLFGYLIYGIFSMLIGLGCLLGSLFFFFKKRYQKAK